MSIHVVVMGVAGCGKSTVAEAIHERLGYVYAEGDDFHPQANIDKMIAVAKEQLGDPYVRGARGPKSFDCSGLVYYCLNQAGSNRRRLNAAGYSQVSDWTKIKDIDGLKKGDLICFYDDDYTKVGHIGIVINSSGEMIDASSSNGKVVPESEGLCYGADVEGKIEIFDA